MPFLAALHEWPDVTQACSKAGIGRSQAYRVYRTEPDFAREWDEAVREGIEAVEDEAWRRTKKSDTMLIFMLKSHKPGIYRETIRQEHTGAEGKPIEIIEARSQLLGKLAALAPESGSPQAD
jgi:hypothetical protein